MPMYDKKAYSIAKNGTIIPGMFWPSNFSSISLQPLKGYFRYRELWHEYAETSAGRANKRPFDGHSS